MSSSMSKEAHVEFVRSLSPRARALADNKDAPFMASGYDLTGRFDDLSPAARQLASEINSQPLDLAPKDLPRLRYAAFVVADGELPKVHIFPGLSGLLTFMRRKEGEDVAVWPLWGEILPFSKGPDRYLCLPGGKQAVMVDDAKIVESLEELELEMEEEGYMGPPSLAVAPDMLKSRTVEAEVAKPRRSAG